MISRLASAAVIGSLVASSAFAEPLSTSDENALRDLSQAYVQSWVRDDRAGVMAVMAPDAIFIPHDGVQPRIGYSNIEAFWFPGGKAVGQVPAYSQSISGISGGDRHATMFGRFDLTWQNSSSRYNWVGNWLIVARKHNGRWLVTHMMASDADPTVTRVGTK